VGGVGERFVRRLPDREHPWLPAGAQQSPVGGVLYVDRRSIARAGPRVIIGLSGQVVWMRVKASTPGQGAAAAHRAPAAPDQLVEDLYRGHALRLTRMALLLVGDRASAEDVVQEAFLGLFRGLGRLSDPGRAMAYLRVSVLNGCRSVLRARKRARQRGAAAEYPVVWSAESAALADEDRREVLAAVA